jgi:hypothetical protein
LVVKNNRYVIDEPTDKSFEDGQNKSYSRELASGPTSKKESAGNSPKKIIKSARPQASGIGKKFALNNNIRSWRTN